jgi:hypothetical protein
LFARTSNASVCPAKWSGMSDPERDGYYATLGLPPDATLEQAKSRFREINDAYLKILELSRAGAKKSQPSPSADGKLARSRPSPDANPREGSSPSREAHTEPIARTKARLEKGEIQKPQFEKLARERYEYLKRKPFSELTESEFEERLHGFEGLKFL